MATKRSNKVAGQPGLDATLPDVKLILGGVERQLAFDFNAVCQAQNVTGINLLKAIVPGNLDALGLRGLLWASLIKHDPEITLEQVGDLITMGQLDVIYQAIVTAWFASIERGKDTGEGKGQARN